MFWQKEYECMDRRSMEALQLERLKHLIDYVYNNVEFYHKRFDEYKITSSKIKTLSDIQHIPFTTKEDLRQNYPFGLFARPKKEIVRIHASSGTTGKPTVVGYTKADLDLWADLIARFSVAVGVTDEDTAQISFGYGLFTGAHGLHQGLTKIGCAVIPISSGNTEKQLMIMEDFGTTVLIATPSYALYLSEMIRERGLADKMKVKIGLFGAEGSTEEMRAQIEKNMNIFATDNYGMSELIGPGVSGECMYRCGMHIAEDHFLPEIIDPDTGEVKAPGEEGELVITTLTKEGFPLLRYRTKDLTTLNYDACKCGRTNVRMSRVKGRSDDMLIIKGVNVFPTQIESAIIGMDHISPHYQLVVRHEKYFDTLEVLVELIDASVLERYSELLRIENSIKAKLKSVLGLECKVRLVEPKTIERTEGKAKRIIDLRNK